MADRRNPEHPLGRMIQAGTLWTFGQFARANDLGRVEADKLTRSYWEKNLINLFDIACKLLPVPDSFIYRHEPRMEQHEDLPPVLAKTFAARYRGAEVQELRVFAPTRKALSIFGMPHAKPPSVTHASHDLLLMEIWLLNRHRGTWMLDPEPPGGRENYEKQPDAGIFTNGKRVPDVFVECCGSYRADRIADLLKFSEGSGIPLEMW